MEELVDLLGHIAAHALDCLNIGHARRRNGTCRAEVLQQRPLARRADARDLVQRAGADRLAPLLAMAADRETVRLVTQPLLVIEHWRAQLESERLLPRQV